MLENSAEQYLYSIFLFSNKQVIKDYKLIMIVNLLLVIDFIILVTWQVIDPPFRTAKEIRQQVVEFCSLFDQHEILYLARIVAYVVMLCSVKGNLAFLRKYAN